MLELQKDIKGKLDNDQYGNEKGCSTTHYLIKVMDEAYRATDKGLATTAITIDYAKAFDFVSHEVLIEKLKNLGVRGSIINLIISFLSNRSHCTKVLDATSPFVEISCGVPQGTCLGPLMFVNLIDGIKCPLVLNFKYRAKLINKGNSLVCHSIA